MLKKWLIVLLLLTSTHAFGKVSVLFHPFDPTLLKIAEKIKQAEESVDIAMYNIDVTTRNPVISTLLSERIQTRIQSGRLKVRIIFEGYSGKVKNREKMAKLESFGLDAKFLGSSKKMHHKFAVIDAFGSAPSLITGSANWSLVSKNNFNENILFFENEPAATHAFAKEFDWLWNNSKEFGSKHKYPVRKLELESFVSVGSDVYFNSNNFVAKSGKIWKNKEAKGFALTRKIVEAIDKAQDQVQIATTRIKLRPIYDAILRAAARDVKINIIVTMGQYEYFWKRKRMQLKECENEFSPKCSSGVNFSVFLDRGEYVGSENVNLRIKYFHVKKAAYLIKQMHSKYIVVDGKRVLTGSFNWSYSAEYGHIENLVGLTAKKNPIVVNRFLFDFDRLWSSDTEAFNTVIAEIEAALSLGSKMSCSFTPLFLTFKQIDYLQNTGRRMGKSLSKVCAGRVPSL